MRLAKRYCPKVVVALMVCSAWNDARPQSAEAWEHSGFASQATVERGIMVPMRDGIQLSASLIRPIGATGPLPTILIRTPYNPDREFADRHLRYFVAHGYAVMFENERGTGWSQGAHQILAGARNDGYDTLSWIAQQPWSNQRVGTLGCSSSAEHQLALAAMNHPAHKAMVAMGPGSAIADFAGPTMGGFYKGGVPMIEWAGWYGIKGLTHWPQMPANLSGPERTRLMATFSPWPANEMLLRFKDLLDQSVLELPSQDILRRIDNPETDFDTLIKLAPADKQWLALDYIRQGDQPRVPALYVDAWHDFTGSGTVKLFEYLQHTPNQFLIMAPTGHCEMEQATEKTLVGERLMGDARYDYDGVISKWFDHWLKEEPNDVLNRPKIQMYMMGANAWKTYPSWPVPEARTMRFYMHSAGRANSVLGNGTLSERGPKREAPDAFVSDPSHPAPSTGGGDTTPNVMDQTAVELREDVLVYSSDVLKEGISLTGEIKVVAYVSSTTPDADLAMKLVDVYPNGKAFNVSDTMLRLRYREGFGKTVLMRPGEVYRVELSGMMTSNYFGPGHRLRIHIAGANFPLYERNLQTGGRNYEDTQPRVASISVHHDPGRASFIEFPVAASDRR
jgi:putative CocE/NonD family hydrolase